MTPMFAYQYDNELILPTVLACLAAVPVLGFVVYLLWRKFTRKRHHRRQRSRMSRYLRE